MFFYLSFSFINKFLHVEADDCCSLESQHSGDVKVHSGDV